MAHNPMALLVSLASIAVVAPTANAQQVGVERVQLARFYPLLMPDGNLFVAFWCYEDTVGMLRWFRFRVD